MQRLLFRRKQLRDQGVHRQEQRSKLLHQQSGLSRQGHGRCSAAFPCRHSMACIRWPAFDAMYYNELRLFPSLSLRSPFFVALPEALLPFFPMTIMTTPV